ncbi:MAG: hypothetical protein KDC28_03205 [Saprospiraceae bacterium]|mgnify:CR=1 FL=1|nr:hypothetical protein [Saprospiraceae bacterium]MCB9318189.1 hypothetical protein [Lewinellaceae bacterium]
MKENPLLVSCKEATVLVEKKLQNELSMVERVQLILHTAICAACRTYQRQSTKIDEILKKGFNQGARDQLDSNALEKRIINHLERPE